MTAAQLRRGLGDVGSRRPEPPTISRPAPARLGQRRLRRPVRRNRRHGRRLGEDRADHLPGRAAGRGPAAARVGSDDRSATSQSGGVISPAELPTVERARSHVVELDRLFAVNAVTLVDIRNPGEASSASRRGSDSVGPDRTRRGGSPPHCPIVVHCAGGWRSSVAASLCGPTDGQVRISPGATTPGLTPARLPA